MRSKVCILINWLISSYRSRMWLMCKTLDTNTNPNPGYLRLPSPKLLPKVNQPLLLPPLLLYSPTYFTVLLLSAQSKGPDTAPSLNCPIMTTTFAYVPPTVTNRPMTSIARCSHHII
jgi:hypothetical protein